MLIIKAEAIVGSDIHNTAVDMIQLSRKLDVLVELKFNDKLLLANAKRDTPEDIVETYRKKIALESSP